MDLSLIRKLCEKRSGGMKKLASDIGMSEANLHRCVNNNKIQASDLEKIALLLNVRVGVFFGENTQELESLENEVQRLKEIKAADKDLYALCRALVENYQQRDDIMRELVSMLKEMK